MTTEALNEFTKALRADEAMARGLVAAVTGKTEGEAVEICATCAKERGYSVTRQDATGLLAAAQAGEGTLTYEQLDGVAGGFYVLRSLPTGTHPDARREKRLERDMMTSE